MAEISNDSVSNPTDSVSNPTVSVIVATRDRPELLRRAVRSFQAQTYPEIVEIVVVFDQSEIDDLADVAEESPLPLRLVQNDRTPGLAGARNAGIVRASGELVAFCDDDDEWSTDKLQRQIDLWAERPSAVGVGTGMVLRTQDYSRARRAPEEMTFEGFLRSREFSIPSSGFLLRTADLLGPVGLVDENLPGSYGEDWDLLLRLTRNGPFVSVPDPVVTVYWDRPSFFTSRWDGLINGLTYLIRKYPEFELAPTGLARMAAQVAFALAAKGDRSESREWARSALRRDPRQPRAWAALAVGTGLVSAESLVRVVNARGRGL